MLRRTAQGLSDRVRCSAPGIELVRRLAVEGDRLIAYANDGNGGYSSSGKIDVGGAALYANVAETTHPFWFSVEGGRSERHVEAGRSGSGRGFRPSGIG